MTERPPSCRATSQGRSCARTHMTVDLYTLISRLTRDTSRSRFTSVAGATRTARPPLPLLQLRVHEAHVHLADAPHHLLLDDLRRRRQALSALAASCCFGFGFGSRGRRELLQLLEARLARWLQKLLLAVPERLPVERRQVKRRRRVPNVCLSDTRRRPCCRACDLKRRGCPTAHHCFIAVSVLSATALKGSGTGAEARNRGRG